MGKKIIKNILAIMVLIIISLLLMPSLALNSLVKVNAADDDLTQISVSGDLLEINSKITVSSIGWSTTNSSSSAISITDKKTSPFSSLLISNKKAYVSVKNGTYYFFGKNTSGGTRLLNKNGTKITSSCNNERKYNQKGTFTVEKCYIANNKTKKVYVEDATSFTCADGYYPDESKTIVAKNGCSGLTFPYGIEQRYCKVVLQATCSKKSTGGGGGGNKVAAAKLASLSVSTGQLSPAFSAGTKTYKVKVDTATSSIKITASAASGGKLVSGYGSRTEKLKYGTNTFYVKVKNSKGAVTSYKIIVERPDGRSSNNTLVSLSLGEIKLTPEFQSDVTNYTANVTSDVESVTVSATLADNKSSFVAGYGPATYVLDAGTNNIYVKVQSEKGEVNVYNITLLKDELPSYCTTDTARLALLKSVSFSVDISGVEIDQIKEFDPDTKSYFDLKVPYQAVNLIVTAATETDGDTYEVSGYTDLEVNEPRAITITVKSKECPNFSSVYTFNVTRQEETYASEESYLDDMKIKNHSEFEFTPEKNDYEISLNKDETSLEFEFKPVAGATCEVFENENLQLGSEIKILCTAEDKQHTTQYTITVDSVKKGANGFLVILLIIIIIIILVYLIMRLLGYKVYLNMSVIGAFFRGIGEKIKNIFDK